jgi:two-component system chemotaxis sensor kinase CheA
MSRGPPEQREGARQAPMQAPITAFLLAASEDLDAVEAALLRAESAAGGAEARRRLAAIAAAAAAAGLTRSERVAGAAEALLARGGAAQHLVFRALMRLREILNGLADTEAEPAGDDSDLIAAAESDRLPSLADTLARARDRLLEVSAENRDPRLSALLERLAALGSELEADAHTLLERPAEQTDSALAEVLRVRMEENARMRRSGR